MSTGNPLYGRSPRNWIYTSILSRRSRAAVALSLVIVLCLSFLNLSAVAAAAPQEQEPEGGTATKMGSLNEITNEGPGFIINQVDGQTVCREATREELLQMNLRDPGQKLRPINHPELFRTLPTTDAPGETADIDSQSITTDDEVETAPPASPEAALQPSAGLTIVLRGTKQLDANPAAKAAFIQAANRWESIIQDKITIVIDVDYGTTRFGQPWGSDTTLGSTSGGSSPVHSYRSFRSLLTGNDGGSNTDEKALYAKLPDPITGLPTDLPTPNVTDILVPTPVARALGALPPNATTDTASSTPSIGFNSNFKFDLDPANGITSTLTDFDAVATHEIGHVLGFTSAAGRGLVTFSSGKQAYVASPWDVFRFKSTVAPTLTNFPTLARTLTVGRSETDLQQAFYGPSASKPGLSTGGPNPSNGSPGDGNQSSHWRADDPLGPGQPLNTYWGIMDPTISRGQRYTITDNDKRALDYMGYRVVGISSPAPPPPAPTLVSLTSGRSLTGSVDAPSATAFTLSQTQYTIQVPSGATQLKIDLAGIGTPDVDLHVRFGQAVALSGNIILDDVRSISSTGTESITLTPTGTPQLKPGTYYIGVLNYGPGGANFGITATVTATTPTPTPTPTPRPTPTPTPRPTPTPTPTPTPSPTPVPTPTPPVVNTIQFSASSYTFNEGTVNTAQGFGSLFVDVIRTNTAAAASVRYFTSDASGGAECNQVTGQASQRCDYAAVAGTLRFAPGQSTKRIQIPIVKDGYQEGNETFRITLQSPVGATLGTNNNVPIAIVDSSLFTTASQNPYVDNQFFVRMNYLDFLAREPDAGGWTTWPTVLNNCGPQKGFLGAPPDCDRAHVSHGFFGSPEFTDTGFLIYRLYEVGMGRLPRYLEFTPDMASLSGFGLTDAVKQQNLTNYLQQFTAKGEFQTRFAGTLLTSQAAALIQKLEQTAGVTLPSTATTLPGQPPQYGRQQLINLRANGTLSVGQTVKAFVEQKIVYDKYFPRGQVTMLYFAYLKRDPSLNDPTLAGWTEWVFVFTNGGAARGRPDIQPRDIHHLIFGFIYSEEYRKRFGQP